MSLPTHKTIFGITFHCPQLRTTDHSAWVVNYLDGVFVNC